MDTSAGGVAARWRSGRGGEDAGDLGLRGRGGLLPQRCRRVATTEETAPSSVLKKRRGYYASRCMVEPIPGGF